MAKSKVTKEVPDAVSGEGVDLRRPDESIPIDNSELTPILQKLNQCLTALINIAGNVQLSPAERKRLQGARARRWGYIDCLIKYHLPTMPHPKLRTP
jgi:hypothetical protein